MKRPEVSHSGNVRGEVASEYRIMGRLYSRFQAQFQCQSGSGEISPPGGFTCDRWAERACAPHSAAKEHSSSEHHCGNGQSELKHSIRILNDDFMSPDLNAHGLKGMVRPD
jgi:hypothetical protein